MRCRLADTQSTSYVPALRGRLDLISQHVVPADRTFHEVGGVLPPFMDVRPATAVPTEDGSAFRACMLSVRMPSSLLVTADAQEGSDCLDLLAAPLSESVFDSTPGDC